jgi:hypothetical protein
MQQVTLIFKRLENHKIQKCFGTSKPHQDTQEKFEDIKGVIRSRKLPEDTR